MFLIAFTIAVMGIASLNPSYGVASVAAAGGANRGANRQGALA